MTIGHRLMRATDQTLQATAASPSTQRGLPRVNAQTTPPSAPRHDTTPQGSTYRDTAPQAPPVPHQALARSGARLRAVTPPPRDTLPFNPLNEGTLSYDGHTLARGFDFEARRQATMPLTPSELSRLGIRESQAVRPDRPTPRSERVTQPNELAVDNVVQLPVARREPGPVDLDLGIARHENDPVRQSALLELAGVGRRPLLPWIIAGVGAGFGAVGGVLALL